jgi:hypothetical protein
MANGPFRDAVAVVTGGASVIGRLTPLRPRTSPPDVATYPEKLPHIRRSRIISLRTATYLRVLRQIWK